MTHVQTEIASQPECWVKAAELAQSPGLTSPGERVAVAGCGTSWFMAKAYAALREQAGQGETDAFQASEFPLGRSYDRVVAITRSGTTTEVIDLLEALRGSVPTTVITADPTQAADRDGTVPVVHPGRVVWAFGEIPAHLIEDVEATGAAFVHARHHSGHAALGRWSGRRSPLDPMADLIVAQRVAVQLATTQGLDPDRPRNLTRSVVLT